MGALTSRACDAGIEVGWLDDDGPLAFLKGMARDPEQAMADVGLDMAGGASRPLLEWLNRVEGRPLPEYSLSHEPPGRSMNAQNDPETGLAERLRRMGIPEDEPWGDDRRPALTNTRNGRPRDGRPRDGRRWDG